MLRDFISKFSLCSRFPIPDSRFPISFKKIISPSITVQFIIINSPQKKL
ncbi:MAG: hypothetical protein F6K65_15355 [Moorea sp. SIO3C2]|nr:hypothetical protein [Moorena sp. SIO3C2]